MLLTLMAMQKNGGFVSNILGDGRGKGWAPEIRGVLSLELVRRSGELKRKRDSGIGLGEEEEEARKTPRLDIEEEGEAMEFGAGDDGFGADHTLGGDGETFNIPGDGDLRLAEDDGIALAGDEEDLSPQGNFDDTTAPLIHPADNGPVSQGTKHAVHLLRERFGGTTGTPKKSASVLFQDLLPQQTTNKSDATKMFFEVLVLATKDAVKVEQDGEALGANIRLRAKRGLWGAWAEKDAGGEIAQQEGTQTAGAVEAAA
jgi:cohesin complex subunit SCC1